ncbi:MAG: type I phosphomannose isomerase catalytic subunit [Thermomicrobiales bacterium]
MRAVRRRSAWRAGRPAFGKRFPILTKLLDTSDWLSVQVHPNDEQALLLEGDGFVGKTEAWHMLETAPGAEIILGLRSGIDMAQFTEAIRGGRTLDVIARRTATAGDTWYIPAGTVHALGPGIFLYEVQQSSDLTYRVYDWDRPASAGRELHLDQAIQCVDPSRGERTPMPDAQPGELVKLVDCPYFQLDRLALVPGGSADLDTRGESFQAVTVVGGSVVIHSGAGETSIGSHETVVVPASTGGYQIESEARVALMISSIPAN